MAEKDQVRETKESAETGAEVYESIEYKDTVPFEKKLACVRKACESSDKKLRTVLFKIPKNEMNERDGYSLGVRVINTTTDKRLRITIDESEQVVINDAASVRYNNIDEITGIVNILV